MFMVDMVKEFGEPDRIDENGDPVWPDYYSLHCPSCKVYHPHHKFHGKWNKHTYCKECVKKRDKERKSDKPERHAGAYAHVIRGDDGELYKCGYEIPEGYDIIYRSLTGYLLPPVFRKLKEYVEK